MAVYSENSQHERIKQGAGGLIKKQIIIFILGAGLGAFSAMMYFDKSSIHEPEIQTNNLQNIPDGNSAGVDQLTPEASLKNNAETKCECGPSSETLPAPQFHPSLSDEIITNFEGEAMVKWTEVRGAKSYRVRLEDLRGQEVKSYKTPRTVIYLKDIPIARGAEETKYRIKLLTINGLDKEGPPSAASKLLIVRPQAKIVAPEVKEIRVED